MPGTSSGEINTRNKLLIMECVIIPNLLSFADSCDRKCELGSPTSVVSTSYVRLWPDGFSPAGLALVFAESEVLDLSFKLDSPRFFHSSRSIRPLQSSEHWSTCHIDIDGSKQLTCSCDSQDSPCSDSYTESKCCRFVSNTTCIAAFYPCTLLVKL